MKGNPYLLYSILLFLKLLSINLHLYTGSQQISVPEEMVRRKVYSCSYSGLHIIVPIHCILPSVQETGISSETLDCTQRIL